MKRIVRLTENDLARIVRRVINEQPTPAPAVKKPPYIGFNYGNITIGISYIVNQGIVTITGYESYADGTKKTLQGVSTAPERIDNAVTEFLTRNGGIRGNLMVPGQTANFRETLKSKLTEMNNNVQNYKKSTPTQK